MAKAVVLGFVGRDELLQEIRSKIMPHGTVSSPFGPPDAHTFETCAKYFFGKLLFSGTRGLNSLMLTFKLTEANYF